MGLLAVASDKGSPGVTTTALTIAAVWPRRAVLAELDPSGGDVAFRLRGPRGTPLAPGTGVLSLGAGLRRGARPEQVFEHVQRLDGGLEVLLGVPTAEHTATLDGIWPAMGTALASIPGVDVVADCGRLYPGAPTLDVLRHASGVLLVTRPAIDAVAHLRARAAALARDLHNHVPGGIPLYVAVVTKPRDEKSPREIDLVLRQANIPATVIGRIAYDVQGAGMLTGEWLGRLDKSLLVRSAREIAARLAQATVTGVTGV
jgi:MinD-like ATPase involved in chromosome partitioning or flagellar assembly